MIRDLGHPPESQRSNQWSTIRSSSSPSSRIAQAAVAERRSSTSTARLLDVQPGDMELETTAVAAAQDGTAPSAAHQAVARAAAVTTHTLARAAVARVPAASIQAHVQAPAAPAQVGSIQARQQAPAPHVRVEDTQARQQAPAGPAQVADTLVLPALRTAERVQEDSTQSHDNDPRVPFEDLVVCYVDEVVSNLILHCCLLDYVRRYVSSGSSSCSTCSSGRYASSGSSSCAQCSAGRAAPSGSSSCNTCSRGQ
jgi:hypothetical protein